MNMRFADRMAGVKPNAIGELLRLGADPAVISFGGGYPDASLFPRHRLAALYAEAVETQGETALQYTVSNGLPLLRAQVAARLTRDGTACGADDVLILQGAQQGLDLAAKLLINPGDVIITENPTFLGALIAFDPCQPRYATVRIDGDGMDTNDLSRVLAANPGARMIYTVPDFQNPTGVTLSLERRKTLIALANRHNVMVLEDTPYRDIRYRGSSLPSLKSLDTEGRVMHLGSFSKILVPSMRLGWAVASRDIIGKLGLLKLAADTQCSTLNMVVTSLFLDRFDIEAHIATIRETYGRKKELMLEVLRQSFPQEIAFTDPSGGLFTWLSFPEGFDAARFMVEKALPLAKVAYVPGGTFFPIVQEANHARVNYSAQPDELIVKGMAALGALLKQELTR